MNETTVCRCSSFIPIRWETVSHHKVLAFPADPVEALDAKLKRTECLCPLNSARFRGEQSIRKWAGHKSREQGTLGRLAMMTLACPTPQHARFFNLAGQPCASLR